MHETAVAEGVIRTITEQAEKHGARPVRARISCGQFNALNDEVMQFAFTTAAEGTICEGLKLEIRHVPLRATCRECKTTFEFDVYQPVCTACESMTFDFEPDAPLLLEEIEFEEDEKNSKP